MAGTRLGVLALGAIVGLTGGAWGRAEDGVSPTVDVTQARALIERHAEDKAFVLLDVRTPEEFAAGHLRDAVNVDLKSAEFGQRLGKLDPTAHYLVYCRTQNRSAHAARVMQDNGFKRVTVMLGGWQEWSTRGFPVAPPAVK